MVKLFVKSEQKWQWYYQKIRARVDSGIWKALKCTITPVVYKRSARSWWQTHKCVGSRLRCSKKFQKSMSELKNSRISCIRWTIGKSFPANQWKVYTAKVCILVVSICQMSSSPNGKPQTWNIFGFQKLILSIPSDVKNQELSGEFFKSEQKMAQISPGNSVCEWLEAKRKWLSPGNCFRGMTVLNWHSSSIIQPSSYF